MKGEQSSKSENQVRAELRRMGINPTSVRAKSKPLFGSAGKKVTPGYIAVFSRQLPTLMKSGVPIVGGLEIIAGRQKNHRANTLSPSLRTTLQVGTSLVEPLARPPVTISHTYPNSLLWGYCASR